MAGAEEESLSKQADHVLEEARMVLPGVQALFGFQLIAVFNQRFETLSETHQDIHLAALFAVALAIAFIMTPAIYHRLAEPTSVSVAFVRLASRCLAATAVPLLAGIGLEFYLVATLIEPRLHLNAVLTAIVVATFAGLWFVLPLVRRARTRRTARSRSPRD
ncbi:MAG: DUF6328 family protein [Burkholderiales bacterium]